MVELIAEIAESVGRISGYKTMDSKPYLRRNNRIRSIHSSLAIEANSLTLDDVRSVIAGKNVIGPQREIQEVKNAYKAYDMLGKFDPYSIEDLQTLHGIMTNLTMEESGTFRTHDDYEFVFIHPFADGNGRMARLWQTALLQEWNSIFQFVPMESRIYQYQEEYYKSIAESNKNGNSDVFIEFILKMISETLIEVTEQEKNGATIYSRQVQELLRVMEYHMPYTASQLMSALGLKSRSSFYRNYLEPALRQKLITMEIPDKPKSRNQRYLKM